MYEFTITRNQYASPSTLLVTDLTLLSQGAMKAYATYTVRGTDGFYANLTIIASTLSDLDRIQRKARAEAKAAGHTMRQLLRDTGTWTLDHVITGYTLTSRPEGMSASEVLEEFIAVRDRAKGMGIIDAIDTIIRTLDTEIAAEEALTCTECGEPLSDDDLCAEHTECGICYAEARYDDYDPSIEPSAHEAAVIREQISRYWKEGKHSTY